MRKSGRLFIVLGVGLALVAAVLAVVAYSGLGKKPAPLPPAKATVIVAARDVPANTVLTQADVQVAQIEKAQAAPGSAGSLGQVVGYASSGALVRGQQILSGNLVAPGLTFDLGNGMRAVALPVDRINALGGLIQADDHIDLVYSVRLKLTRILPTQPIVVQDSTTGYAKTDTLVLPPPGSTNTKTYPYPGDPGSQFTVQDMQAGDPVAKIVLQNLRVLRVIAGNVTVAAPASATNASARNASATATPSAGSSQLPNSDLLVLEVDPQQAEVIKFVEDNNGNIEVALRAKDDTSTATTKGVTYNQLVTDYGLPVPRTVQLPGGQ
ncbi:MAG TPA: Flp pilus assembly protein CpaB [Thermomicrobiaceae bacterium]|nr:Flp pilus assembly protein CpaB [Thermomicrobiaceae bacterium]